jgi:hypothetical protein
MHYINELLRNQSMVWWGDNWGSIQIIDHSWLHAIYHTEKSSDMKNVRGNVMVAGVINV